MNWEKYFKKSDKNKKENQFDSNKKLGLERTMNGLGKPFNCEKIPIQKIEKKNQREIAACEQNTTCEKEKFSAFTVFSLYLKIRAKFHTAKPLAFLLNFLFQRDQNHCSNLTSKS